MNTTEERLHDALRAAGETIESVPAFVVPARRFSLRRIAVFASVAALVLAGVAFWSGKGPESSPALGSPETRTSDIDVFLCIDKSSNPDCRRRDATAAQRRQIMKMLSSHPQVKSVEYEDLTMAWTRFNKAFSGTPGFASSPTKVGDIPDSFRVLLKDSHGDATAILQMLNHWPGVDQVLDERKLQGRP